MMTNIATNTGQTFNYNVEMPIETWMNVVAHELCYVTGICRDVYYMKDNQQFAFLPRVVTDQMVGSTTKDDEIDRIAILINEKEIEFTAKGAISVIRAVADQMIRYGKIVKEYMFIDQAMDKGTE